MITHVAMANACMDGKPGEWQDIAAKMDKHPEILGYSFICYEGQGAERHSRPATPEDAHWEVQYLYDDRKHTNDNLGNVLLKECMRTTEKGVKSMITQEEINKALEVADEYTHAVKEFWPSAQDPAGSGK